ncbi:MAG TPA: hypothetical protein VER78_00715 [Thermoanaerobaculia bacterium]|nr:hypothetical protein [Thermoanaerobaculia bacterium]
MGNRRRSFRARGGARASRVRKGWSRLAACLLLLLVAAAALACRKAPAAFASVGTPQSDAVSQTPPRAPASAEATGYPFTAAERAAVEGFLRRHPDLRVASDEDRRPSDGDDVHSLYGVYHPYFVRGDINDDGVLDFVLAFVRRDSGRDTPWFSVVVFTGKKRPGRAAEFSEGTYIERDVSLARGDVSIDRDAVLITPDLSDEAVRRYRWDPVRRSHVFVRDEEEEAPQPPVSRT